MQRIQRLLSPAAVGRADVLRRSALAGLLAVVIAAVLVSCSLNGPEVAAKPKPAEPQMCITAADAEGQYDVRLRLPDGLPGPQMRVLAGQAGKVTIGTDAATVQSFEVTVTPEGKAARATYSLILAVQGGFRQWTGKNVAWPPGEWKALAEDFEPPAAAPAGVPAGASTGRIAKIEGDVLTLHVLRGHSGIMRPVQLSRATVVIRPDGKVGAIADLKPDQWVKVTFAEKWTDRRWINAVRIEPAAAPWPAAPPATREADPAALTRDRAIEIANEEAKKAYRKKHGMAANAVVGDFDYPRKPTGSRYNTQVKAEGENRRVIFTISLTVAGRTTVNRTEVMLDKTGKPVGEVKFQTLKDAAPGLDGGGGARDAAKIEADVASLVKQLGDNDWKAREQATQRLKRLIAAHGRPAADRIARELKSPDPEVRRRVEILLEKFGLKEGMWVPVPLGRWSGTVKDEKLQRLAPREGYVADADAWAALWKAWRGDEPLPAVDFAAEIVVVSWVSGLKADWDDVFYAVTPDGGLVNTTTIAGRPPFRGFGYLLMRVKREGIRRVFGRAVNAGAGAGVEAHLPAWR